MKLMNAIEKQQNKGFHKMIHYEKSKMFSSNQLASYVFNDGKLIPIQSEMTQSQIRNNNTFFNLLPATN